MLSILSKIFPSNPFAGWSLYSRRPKSAGRDAVSVWSGSALFYVGAEAEGGWRAPLESFAKFHIDEVYRALIGNEDRTKKVPEFEEQSEPHQRISSFSDSLSTVALYRTLSHVLDVMGNSVHYNAQKVLDLLQLLLDFPIPVDNMAASRDQLLRELLLLSSKTHLYPSCLTFSDVKRSKKAVAPGRFGEVYRGSIHERPVALKIFKVYCQNDFQKITKAVSKEAILWGQLDHRNILPLYGLCNPIGSQYFGMVFPWMENGNVLHYLKANRSVNRLSLVSDVAQGVSYLHEQRIVHGDLKGMNILVTESGHACLTDFGLASLIERTEIVSWTSVQRVANHSDMIRWQAPECFRDPENNVSPYVTTHADMWAFACVCYEITTGNVPFYEYSRDTTVLKQLTTGQKPSKPAPDSDAFTTFGLTEDLWSLMDRCWSPQPQSRPTAREVLDSEPLHIQRDSRPQFRWDVKGSRFRLGVKQWIAVSQ